MKKFEGILICTDLDGTLLRGDKSVSRENLDAIEYFKSEGGYFTIVTGRMPCTVGDIYETVKPNAPIGCINGGGVYDFATGKYVWKTELCRDAFELVRMAEEQIPEIGYQVNTFDDIYFCRENEAMAHFRKVTGYPNKVMTMEEIRESVSKIVFGDLNEKNILELAELLKKHPRYDQFDYIRSEKRLYEILPKGVSKGGILPHLCDYLGTDMRYTVGVGDYDNDASMLEAARVGVAVANATERVKESADLITVSNEEHAIAKIIRDIEEKNIRF